METTNQSSTPPTAPGVLDSMLETVYVLTNPAMPGLVKIGFTSNEDAKKRIDGLYSTGVPFPFKIEFVCKVPNAQDVEKALHVAFGPDRVNPKREFFQINSEQAIAVLKLLHVEETTEQVAQQCADGGVDPQSLAAAEQYSKRRPNLNFEEMGIPVGSQLVCTQNEATVTVVGPKKVKLDDEELSLTAATRQVLQLEYSVAPGPYWTFNGKSIREIYNETYTDVD